MRGSCFFLLFTSLSLPAWAWVAPNTPTVRHRQCETQQKQQHVDEDTPDRRRFLQNFATTTAFAATAVLSAPRTAQADVYSGTELPKGVAQFNRCIRLKRDLKKVTKRVQDASNEMDAAEWDNVGKFLRQVYSLAGDDMKLVAGTIVNADMKQRALQDADKLRQYAQAADVPVSAKDAAGFLVVAQKMNELVQDYFDALVDVPDL